MCVWLSVCVWLSMCVWLCVPSACVAQLLTLEAESVEERAGVERNRERLAAEARHLQRKLARVTKESEQKMAEERIKLEQQLAESSRRSEAKLRAERTRLAVRYGNQGKPGQPKIGELSAESDSARPHDAPL